MNYKILVTCDNLLPPQVKILGGKNIYLIQKMISLSNSTMVHISTFVNRHTVPNWKKWVRAEEARYGIKYHVIDLPLKSTPTIHFFISKLLSFFITLYYQIICKYDLIHEYSSSPFLINRTYLLGLLTRTKTVHTLCTVNKGLFGSTSLVLKSTDRVVCVADSMRKRLEKRLPRQKIDLIPIPIEDSFFYSSQGNFKKKFDIKTEKAVLFCGLLDGRKGIACFLKAIPEIIENNPDTSIVIVTAPGLNTSTVARQNKNRVLSALKHHGEKIIFIEKEIDMPSLFAAVDVFVYPLLTMHGTLGSPSILIEGMATGKAIVASNLREVSDIIIQGKNALLFSPGNSKELAQCVNKLLKDCKLRESLGKQAKQDSKGYSLSEVSNKIMSLYDTLTQKKK